MNWVLMKFILMIIWGYDMRRLFVFVEGHDDEMFIKQILLKYFPQNHMALIPIRYQSKPNIKIIKHIKQINLSNNLDYIFLSDLDSHSYSNICDRKNKRIREFHHEKYDDLDPEKIFIVVEEIESWFIAGIDSSIDQFKHFCMPFNTDSLTKEDFEKLIGEYSIEDKITFLIEICKHYNIELASKRNSSLNYFLEKLEEL